MILDPDAYLDESLSRQKQRLYKATRHQPNWQKLPAEKTIVPIILDIQLRPDFVLRDRFDFDLTENNSPEQIVKYLNDYLGTSINSSEIYEQIIDFIDKNTQMSRSRYNKTDQWSEHPTCMNCDSLINPNFPDYCRACESSLEKMSIPKQPANTEEANVSTRQTTRQKTLEERRKTVDQQIYMKGKKLCKHCGENNQLYSTECRSCQKPFKSNKKLKTIHQHVCMEFWNQLNRDTEFANFLMHSDAVEEQDFLSSMRLYQKLMQVIHETDFTQGIYQKTSQNKQQHLINTLNQCYDKCMLSSEVKGQRFNPSNPIQLKELDASSAQTQQIPQPARPQAMPIMQDNSYQNFHLQDQPRKRGRPRKNPLPITIKPTTPHNFDMNEETIQAKTISSGQDDEKNLENCGVCKEPGELLCCEVCPAVFHIACLNMNTFPRGRWMCYFCRIVKNGIVQAQVREEQEITLANQVKALFKPIQGWKAQALQILDILQIHPIGEDFFQRLQMICFRNNIQVNNQARDLQSIRDLIMEDKIADLDQVDNDIKFVFKWNMRYCKKRNPKRYAQAFNMELFYNKIISELQNLHEVSLFNKTVQSQSNPVV